MIDWKIAKIASSGMRGMRIRLRPMTIRPSDTAWRKPPWGAAVRTPAPAVMRPSRPSRPPSVVVVLVVFGDRVTGQRQEDVVERRPAEADVVDGDPRFVEVADDLRQVRRPVVGRDREPAGVQVEGAFTGETADEDLACALDVVTGMDDDLDAGAADLSLELVGRAAGDDLAVVDDRDESASSSASSRYCVVSRSVVPSRTSAADDVPHAQPAARVETGRRLVEEQQAGWPIRALPRSSRRRIPPE